MAGAATATAAGAPIARTTVNLAVKQTKTTGSIGAGSNQLTVASASGFAVNDNIIVELGGEASAGAVGSPGVGGVWPTLTYANEAAMNADTSQATLTFCYCVGSGLVYRWNRGDQPNIWYNDPLSPYWQYAVPLALTAKIAAINGNVLTLNAAAAVASTNANVYWDCAPVFNALTGHANTAYVFPAGTFAIGSLLGVGSGSGQAVFGQGQGVTILMAPKGSSGVGIITSGSDYFEAANFTVNGNNFLTGGWGLLFQGQLTNPTWSYSVLVINSLYANIHDITSNHAFYTAGTRGCGYATFSRITANKDTNLCYINWEFNFANSTYCNSYDCTANCNYLCEAFECFSSNYCSHIRPATRNGIFSLNSAGYCTIDTPTIVITANSQYGPVSFAEPGDPCFSVNTNIGQNAGFAGVGNAIKNMNVTIQGYINANNDVPQGVNASTAVVGSGTLLVSGGSFSAPDYVPPTSATYGAQAINSNTGVIMTCTNLTVTGKAKDGGTYNGNFSDCNITIALGTLTGQSADTWYCNGAHS